MSLLGMNFGSCACRGGGGTLPPWVPPDWRDHGWGPGPDKLEFFVNLYTLRRTDEVLRTGAVRWLLAPPVFFNCGFLDGSTDNPTPLERFEGAGAGVPNANSLGRFPFGGTGTGNQAVTWNTPINKAPKRIVVRGQDAPVLIVEIPQIRYPNPAVSLGATFGSSGQAENTLPALYAGVPITLAWQGTFTGPFNSGRGVVGVRLEAVN